MLLDVNGVATPSTADTVDSVNLQITYRSISMKICKRCGGSNYNNDGKCIPCTKIRRALHTAKNSERLRKESAIWRKINPEKAKLLTQTWRESNKEKVHVTALKYRTDNKVKRNLYCREYRAANSGYVADYNKLWRKINQEIVRNHRLKRRALMRGAKGELSVGLFDKLYKYQQGKCACCKEDLKKVKPHMDHIMPLALGGSNTDNNIQLLCSTCNHKKHAKHPIEFMQSRGFLC
jgi:5-methylcytosine-specific restriction endonuclease McrA